MFGQTKMPDPLGRRGDLTAGAPSISRLPRRRMQICDGAAIHHDDLPAFYKKHEAVWDAFSPGRPFTIAKVLDQLRAYHRVIRWNGQGWEHDPLFPQATRKRLDDERARDRRRK